MKNLIIILAAIATLFSATAWSGYSPVIDRGEVDPWPLGEECPFPWEDMKGLWQLKEADETVKKMYVEFKVLTEVEGSSRLFEVTVLSNAFEPISTGRGLAEDGSKIIRAAVKSVGQVTPSSSHWAIFRTYKRDEGVCGPENLINAFTLRPLQETEVEGDRHYELEKIYGDGPIGPEKQVKQRR